MFWKIRKVDRRFEHGGGLGLFCPDGFDAQRKRRQRQLFIFEFDHSANRLAGEDMFGQYEAHGDARERYGRENAGQQNEGDKTRENQEEEIVSGVQRRERDKNDPADIDPTLEGDAVLHFVTEPAERRALRQDGNERYTHPAGEGERGKRGRAGEPALAYFRRRPRAQRQETPTPAPTHHTKPHPHAP